MFGTANSRIYSYMLAFCLLTLLLAVAWPAASAAQESVPPGPPPGDSGTTLPVGDGGPAPSTDPPTTPSPTATPTPTSTPGGGDPFPPDPTGGGGDPLPPDPTGGSGNTLTLAQTLAEYELIKALAPNRIIFHAATPIQLCKVEDGLQIYYISRKGKTRLGPYVPSFAELAAKYPDGDEASIYFGFNPLTGKRVKIDYLPAAKRIRVDTFYADRDKDKNKQYIFHFGPEHDITYDTW